MGELRALQEHCLCIHQYGLDTRATWSAWIVQNATHGGLLDSFGTDQVQFDRPGIARVRVVKRNLKSSTIELLLGFVLNLVTKVQVTFGPLDGGFLGVGPGCQGGMNIVG